jgi:hypothetical protein
VKLLGTTETTQAEESDGTKRAEGTKGTVTTL